MMDLMIDVYGSKLTVENSMLCVSVHNDKKYFPFHEIDSVYLGKGCLLSYNAIESAIQNNIDIVLLNKQGKPLGRFWKTNFGSISQIRVLQTKFIESNKTLDLVKTWISEKINHQISILKLLTKPDNSTQNEIKHAVLYMNLSLQKIEKLNGSLQSASSKLRSFEAISSKYYFECINLHLPYPYRFTNRNRHPSQDAFNCVLNYLYGILYSKIEIELIKAGVDPHLGIFHRLEYNKPTLVYDIIEKFRHWADYVTIDLCQQQLIHSHFFDIQPDFSLLLNGEGKKIVVSAFSDFMNEVVAYNQTERTRNTHITLYAQQLANLFKSMKNENK